MFRFIKIRSQLQIALGALVVLIIVVLGLVHYNSVKRSVINKYKEDQVLLTILKAAQSEFQSRLNRAIETSESLADNLTIISWFENNEVSDDYKNLSLNYLDNLHKQQKYPTVFAVNAITLNYWRENYDLLDVLSKDDSDDSWFFDALSRKVKTSLNFDYNRELNRTILFINVLMYSADSVVGIAGVGVDPTILMSDFEEHKPSKDSRLWLVDNKGKVTMSSNIEEINNPLNDLLPESFIDLLLRGEEKKIISDQKVSGRDVELAFIPLANTRYKMVMMTPDEQLFPILSMIRNQTFYFSLIFLFLTLLVVSLLSKKITKPLRRLQYLSEHFTEDNLQIKIDDDLIKRRDEIGLLALAFKTMNNQLVTFIEKVKQTNIELEEEKKQLNIANEQLNDALHKASESERLTQSFLANISHEIRTPMNSILGFSQLLEYAEIDSEEHKLYASHVVRGGQQLLSILDSIINLSKIESGIIKPKKEQVFINKILAETFELYNLLAQQKGLKMNLKVDLNNDDCYIVSDKALFQLVLNNLVSNAIKYTNKGSVEIGYKLEKKIVEFYVSDTGIGISNRDIETIFKPFRQVQFNHLETTGGAGLGLAIVSKVLHVIGGTIRVDSEPGLGSTFYVKMSLEKKGRT